MSPTVYVTIPLDDAGIPTNWRFWPRFSRENDDNDALRRYMWPQGLLPNYRGPKRYELFNMPFAKRKRAYTGRARGHLRFVKRPARGHLRFFRRKFNWKENIFALFHPCSL